MCRVFVRRAMRWWLAIGASTASFACFPGEPEAGNAEGPIPRAEQWLDRGTAHFAEGRLDEAEKAWSEALVLAEQAADPELLGRVHDSTGRLALRRADFEAADRHGRLAVQALESVSSDSLELGEALHYLGLTAWRLGDYSRSDRLLSRALELKELHAPHSPTLAYTVRSLGNLARELAQWERAEAFYRQNIELAEQDASDPLAETKAWTLLAQLELEQGKLEAAEQTLAQARALSRGREGEAVVLTFYRGVLAESSGRLEEAAALYSEVLEAYLARWPGHPDLVNLRLNLGGVLIGLNHFEQADEVLEQAFRAASGDTAPGWLARVEHRIGELEETRGNVDAALRWYLRAVRHTEEQVERLEHGQHHRGNFREKRGELFWDPIRLTVAHGQDDSGAFDLMERFRATEFRAMLRQRDLRGDKAPPGELLAERGKLVDRIHQLEYLVALHRWSDDVPSQEVVDQLQGLRQERRRLESRIRSFVDARLPQVLGPGTEAPGAGGWKEALDPGTALVSYVLGPDDTSLVFAAHGERAGWHEVAAGHRDLELRVERFRRGIARAQVAREPVYEDMMEQGEALFRLLVEPIWPRISGATRLLIVPDGPLHALPFSALVLRDRGSPVFLAEKLASHVTLSVEIYRSLRRGGVGGRETARLVAFGDPDYPPSPVGAEWAQRGFALSPIPASRLEVEAIADLFGERSELFLGARATEAAAKALGTGADIIHFAVHAFLESESGLDSALALTLPATYRDGEENGLLQAWEVFEQMRLDADLVVLSACSTGRGQSAGSEGVVGLTRAFHYAGARSVLSSLWHVDDGATADLMKVFYRRLMQGASKDEALRQAQLSLLAREETRAPFFWAAFQLDGDRR